MHNLIKLTRWAFNENGKNMFIIYTSYKKGVSKMKYLVHYHEIHEVLYSTQHHFIFIFVLSSTWLEPRNAKFIFKTNSWSHFRWFALVMDRAWARAWSFHGYREHLDLGPLKVWASGGWICLGRPVGLGLGLGLSPEPSLICSVRIRI